MSEAPSIACPRGCGHLTPEHGPAGAVRRCGVCGGERIALGAMRTAFQRAAVDQALAASRQAESELACSDCGNAMGAFSVDAGEGAICVACNLAWLEGGTTPWLEGSPAPKEISFDHGGGPKEGYVDVIVPVGAKGWARVRDRSVSNWRSLIVSSPLAGEAWIGRALVLVVVLLVLGFTGASVRESIRLTQCQAWCVEQGHIDGRTVPRTGSMNNAEPRCYCVSPTTPYDPPSITYDELDAWAER